MEPTIYKPGAYKTPGIYNGAGGIYKGRGVYNEGEGGEDFVEIGGRRYPVVKIGNQLWIAKNLDYKFDYNGSTLPIGDSGVPSTPAAWYYNNDENLYGIDGTYKCGLLYNWYAANYLDNNKNTLLPNGWRVPSQNDFDDLSNAVGGASIAGTKLKALDNSVTISFPSGFNGTNDYGFNALPAGDRLNTSFDDFGTYCNFWSGYDYSETRGYNYYITSAPNLQEGYAIKEYAISIRLVKDA